MMTCNGNLDKDKLVSKDGLRQPVPYVYWKVGDAEIVLDGHFTVADLCWLADFVSREQMESAGD